MQSNLPKQIKQARVISGWVLIAALSLHLLGHASGIFGLKTMEFTGELFGEFIDSPWTLWVMPTALAVHFICAFEALLQRYSFRSLTPYQWVQYASGFLIPFLLIGHLASIALGHWVLGVDVGYKVMFLELWGQGLNSWFLTVLLLLLAIHAGLGIWFFLRSKPWFWRVRNSLFLSLFLIPILALAGVYAGSNQAALRLSLDPGWRQEVRSQSNYSPQWGQLSHRGTQIGIAVYISLLLLLLVLQQLLSLRGRQLRVYIRYPDGNKVGIKLGATILQASNLARIPHAQLCQGQGRCSTCRVYIAEGRQNLEPAGQDEREVLSRFQANDNIRLACQARLKGDCRIDLLISPEIASVQAAGKRQKFVSDEKEVVLLFSDIRGFTKFSEHKLPYDVVFILNRYFQDMGQIIEKNGGYLDKFIGDGTMAIFGLSQPPEVSAAQALATAKEMGAGLSRLNRELTSELAEPLKIGVGLHLGKAIVGEMGYKSALTLTAIGDTVNTSSRLESMTKEAKCFLICSDEVALASKIPLGHLKSGEVNIRGKSHPQKVWFFPDADSIPSPRG